MPGNGWRCNGTIVQIAAGSCGKVMCKFMKIRTYKKLLRGIFA
jgi:hypothetical protein